MTQNNTGAGARRVPTGIKIAYGMGTGIIAVKNMLFHYFFLFFFSNIMGLSEGLVLAATLIALFIDMITDPLMGQVSDNYRSKKWGRRHGFMLVSLIPTAAALALLFAPPGGMGTVALFIWMTALTVTVRLGLTVYGVPYFSLSAELSTDYNDRTAIMSFRELFGNMFNLLVFIIAFTVFFPDNPALEDGMMNTAGYAPFALTMALMGTLTALISIFGTRRVIPDIQPAEDAPRTDWRQTGAEIMAACRVPGFTATALGLGCILIIYGVHSALTLYVGVYLWKFSQGAKLVTALAPFAALIPTVILATWLPKKIDKKPSVLLFALLQFTAGCAPFAAWLLGFIPETAGDDILGFVAGLGALSFVGMTGVLILSSSMLADVADVMEARTGRRQEGVLFAAFSFAQKLTFALGTALGSIILMIIKFPKQAEPSAVDIGFLNALAGASLIKSLLLGCLALWMFSRYPHNRARIAALQAQKLGKDTP